MTFYCTAILLTLVTLAPRILLAASLATFTPQGETSIVRQVHARFTTSMIPLGDTEAPAPFQWSCQLPGTGHWVDDKNWVFDIKSELPANTSCRFTLRPGLTDLSGHTVTNKTTYTFTTGPLSIVQSWPSKGETIEDDQAFLLQFNGPITTLPAVYCQAVDLAERLPMVQLSAKDSALLFKELAPHIPPKQLIAVRCPQRLPAGAKMTLLYFRKKGQLADRIPFDVRPPFNVSLKCTRETPNAACLPLKPIQLAFSFDVPQKLARQIRLVGTDKERSPQLTQPDDNGSVDNVTFSAPFPPLSTLKLVLPANFTDVQGRALTNAKLFPLPVSFSDLPPLVKFSAAPFGIIEAGPDAAVPLTLRGVEAKLPINLLKVGGHVLHVQDDQQIVKWLNRVTDYHESRIETGKDHFVESRRLSLLSKERSATPISLPLQPKADGTWPFEVVGIPLTKPGFYVLEVESRLLGKHLLGGHNPMYVRTAALVTHMAVHLKHSRENAAIWVTTLDRAQPVSGAAVTVYNCRGEVLWHGKTNHHGNAHVPYPLIEADCSGTSATGFFATARKTTPQGYEDVSFVHSNWNRGIESWRFPFPINTDPTPSLRAHTVLDRSLFKTGETVSMKHLLRIETARGFAMPAANQLPQQLRIVHEGSHEETILPLSWRQGRYAESTFSLPKTARLGDYSIYLERKGTRKHEDSDRSASLALDGYSLISGSFRVSAFRLPTMLGHISTTKKLNIAPTEVPLSFSLTWANGGAAKHWPIEVSAMLSEASSWTPERYQNFNFSPPAEPRTLSNTSLDNKIVLNKATMTLDTHGSGTVTVSPLPKLNRRYDLIAEASYRDPNGEVQTLSQRIPLWPAALQIGMDVNHWVAVGRTLNVKTLVLDTNGNPMANRPIHLRAVNHHTFSTRKRLVGGFYAWEHHETTRDLGTVCQGRSDSLGLALCTMTLHETGEIELIAEASDDLGNKTRTAQTVWVSDHDELWFNVENNDRIDILPEKIHYNPGEIARFQVRMPFRSATAWIAIEREGILETKVVQLEGKNPTITLPIQANWAPNVYVSVLAIRGRIRDVPWYSFFSWGWQTPYTWWKAYWNEGRTYTAPTALVDLGKPAFKFGIAEIRVGDDANRLLVDVLPGRKIYGVRDTAYVKVRVRFPNGKPVPEGSEVAFAAVDEALLELQPNRSWELLHAMYQQRSYGISTATAQLEVVGKRHYGRKALPPGGGGGHIPTRELLDTLLIWQPRLLIGKEGIATIKVPTHDALSRFRLVAVADVGTHWFGTGSATITTAQDLQLIAGIPPQVYEGDRFTAGVTLRNGTNRTMNVHVLASAAGLTKLPPQMVSIPANEVREITWPITIPRSINELKWTFEAKETRTGNASDRLAITQKVASVVPVTTQQATLLRVNPSASLPLALPTNAEPNRGGIVVTLQSKLTHELPAVQQWFEAYPYSCLEQRVSVALGLQDRRRWENILNELPLYLDRHGLAAYFPRKEDAADNGSDILTAYLLTTSHEAQWEIPPQLRERMLDGLRAFVEGRLRRHLPLLQQDLDARRLAAMAALARYHRFHTTMRDTLALSPQKWTTAMLIDWLSVLNQTPTLPHRAKLIQQTSHLLQARLSFQGSRIILSTEPNNRGWLMSNTDVDTAKLLLSVHRLPEWQNDLPRLLKGLIGQQVRGTWQTTTANLWGLLAVQRIAKQLDATPVSGSTRITLNSTKPITINWNTQQQPAPQQLPWPNQSHSKLTLTHLGQGSPWATVQAQAAIKLTSAQSAGFTLRKQLTPIHAHTTGNYHIGDSVKVRLDIDAQSDMTWVVIDDPIPSGATLLGSGLQRDSYIAQTSMNRSNDLFIPTFEERQFGRYRAYYDYVPRGHFAIEYTMRLNTAGTFNLPPSRVEAMYSPDIFAAQPNPPFNIYPE